MQFCSLNCRTSQPQEITRIVTALSDKLEDICELEFRPETMEANVLKISITFTRTPLLQRVSRESHASIARVRCSPRCVFDVLIYMRTLRTWSTSCIPQSVEKYPQCVAQHIHFENTYVYHARSQRLSTREQKTRRTVFIKMAVWDENSNLGVPFSKKHKSSMELTILESTCLIRSSAYSLPAADRVPRRRIIFLPLIINVVPSI